MRPTSRSGCAAPPAPGSARRREGTGARTLRAIRTQGRLRGRDGRALERRPVRTDVALLLASGLLAIACGPFQMAEQPIMYEVRGAVAPAPTRECIVAALARSPHVLRVYRPDPAVGTNTEFPVILRNLPDPQDSTSVQGGTGASLRLEAVPSRQEGGRRTSICDSSWRERVCVFTSW